MRICIVSQEYPPETAKGGIGTQAIAKARGLAKRGHDVEVISRSLDGRQAESFDNSIRITRVASTPMAVYTAIADWLTHSAAVTAAISAAHDRRPFDLVEFPEWACEGYVHLLNRCEWNHMPTIIHLHGPLAMLAETIGWPDRESEFCRVGRQMEATCLRLADAVYSSSECSADWVAREYGLPRGGIPVLHTGVDTELFGPLDGMKAARPTIVFAGKLARNKGIGLLVEAVLRLADDFPGLRLQILGRGEADVVAELRAAAALHGRTDLLELVGFVNRQQIPNYFSQAHVFAAPSRYEGGPGFVYLEAMACGLPVIACEGSGAAEVVQPGVTGFLIPPGDVEALSAALRTLISDPVRAVSMGRAARQSVIETAESETCLDRLEAYYAAIVQQRGSANGSRATFRREVIV